ncbi:MAG: hypothetical protein EB141_07760 [Verrucomicrobia bacterium]|nr:hypothetical protein [Verrucomicrobiota bacterium]
MSIRTHPSYATAHENLGDIYAKMASQAYDKALQLDKSNTAAQTKLEMIKELFSSGTRGTGKPAAGKTPSTVVAAVTSKPAPVAPPPATAPAVTPTPSVANPTPAPATKPAEPAKSTASSTTADENGAATAAAQANPATKPRTARRKITETERWSGTLSRRGFNA